MLLSIVCHIISITLLFVLLHFYYFEIVLNPYTPVQLMNIHIQATMPMNSEPLPCVHYCNAILDLTYSQHTYTNHGTNIDGIIYPELKTLKMRFRVNII